MPIAISIAVCAQRKKGLVTMAKWCLLVDEDDDDVAPVVLVDLLDEVGP